MYFSVRVSILNKTIEDFQEKILELNHANQLPKSANMDSKSCLLNPTSSAEKVDVTYEFHINEFCTKLKELTDDLTSVAISRREREGEVEFRKCCSWSAVLHLEKI